MTRTAASTTASAARDRMPGNEIGRSRAPSLPRTGEETARRSSRVGLRLRPPAFSFAGFASVEVVSPGSLTLFGVARCWRPSPVLVACGWPVASASAGACARVGLLVASSSAPSLGAACASRRSTRLPARQSLAWLFAPCARGSRLRASSSRPSSPVPARRLSARDAVPGNEDAARRDLSEARARACVAAGALRLVRLLADLRRRR